MNGKKSLGVMIDLSRNAVKKPETLKRFAALIKKMRYDTLYMYMEDVYEIEGEPRFGQNRGRYTKEELKDIDDYCYSIGIEVVPCIQTLAHLNGMFYCWNYYEINDIDDILLIDEPKTYELIEKMIKTMRECFRTKRINIGMDEAQNIGRGKYLTEHGYENPFKLMNRHLSKVLAITDKYGFQATMWSDMFFSPINRQYHVNKIKKEELMEIKSYVPQNVTLCYWDYVHNSYKDYMKNMQAHKILTDKVAFAGGIWAWLGFAPLNKSSIQKTKAAIKGIKPFDVDEVFYTVWGDNGGECSLFSLLPSLLYGAEAYYGNFDMASIKQKFLDMFGIKWDDFIKVDLMSTRFGKYATVPSKFGLYNDAFCGKEDCNVQDGDEQNYVKYTRKLSRVIPKTGEYSYIFENLKNLSSVMELKLTLGIKTRKAYLENDRAELECIAYKVYPKLLKRLDRFYDGFHMQWHKENKPQGFEIQDIRLGGLKQRLRNCMNTLRKYLKGELDSLPELEMPLVKQNAAYYAHIVTANAL